MVRSLLAGTAARVGPEAVALADAVSTALEQGTDSRAIAERLAATPFHGVYGAAGAAIVADGAIPFLLLKLGQPELALSRLLGSARQEPTDVVPFLQVAQLDALRCRPEFVALVAELGLVDPRASRACASDAATSPPTAALWERLQPRLAPVAAAAAPTGARNRS